MMDPGIFLRNTAVLLSAMALLSVLETAIPFFRGGWRRRHALPNLTLTALSLVMNFVLNAGTVFVTASLANRGFGLLAGARLPQLAIFVVAFLTLDGATYLCHRLMHALPVLWSVHAVHHSDPLVDVTTALRFHPVETAWRFLFAAGPALLLGLPAPAVALYRTASAFWALFEHVNVRLWQPLDSALSLAVGTPNMHKVHHSRRTLETDTNYGNVLSLFDRLLGTFTPTERASGVTCGLDGFDAFESQTVGALLRRPFPESAASRRHIAEAAASVTERNWPGT